MTYFAILVAGGVGKRMGGDVPKQFLRIGEKTILQHSIERFRQAFPEIRIVVSLHADYLDFWKEEMENRSIPPLHGLVTGGEERFHSIQNALNVIRPDAQREDIIGVHDAVRPMVTAETIRRCYHEAERHGSAVPVIPLKESIREIHGDESHSVNRADFRIVQTPQCFRAERIINAYEQEFHKGFTDDASVVESAGYAITLCEGNPENIKITQPLDMVVARESLIE